MGKRLAIALDLLAWMPMLALNGEARLWDLRRLRSPPVQPGRPTRHRRPPSDPPPCPPLARDPYRHRCPRLARPAADHDLTSSFPAPASSPSCWPGSLLVTELRCARSIICGTLPLRISHQPGSACGYALNRARRCRMRPLRRPRNDKKWNYMVISPHPHTACSSRTS
jgi:hypothetical protein